MSFNKVIILGNLTRDPELRFTPKGMAVAKLTLAVNRKWKSEIGESKEEVAFVDVDAFGKQAEALGQYLKKGRALLVEGRLKQDNWNDKATGQKRSKLGVALESFTFVDKIPDKGAESAPAPPTSAPAPAANTDEPPHEGDDVPF